jgi:hypothetical protein
MHWTSSPQGEERIQVERRTELLLAWDVASNRYVALGGGSIGGL